MLGDSFLIRTDRPCDSDKVYEMASVVCWVWSKTALCCSFTVFRMKSHKMTFLFNGRKIYSYYAEKNSAKRYSVYTFVSGGPVAWNKLVRVFLFVIAVIPNFPCFWQPAEANT